MINFQKVKKRDFTSQLSIVNETSHIIKDICI
jgi:hypothetical protein